MPFGCGSCGKAQNILWGERWWLPSSLGRGESCESEFVCGLFVLQKYFNYASTNLLFGLCRFVWVIKCLPLFLVPSRSFSTPIYPQSVANQGACPNSLFFHCFHFKFPFEFIKELGNVSCPKSYPMSCPQEDKFIMQSRWCREWHLPSRPHIKWIMKSWKSLRFNLKNFSRKDTSNLTSHHLGHMSFLFATRMGCRRCVWIIKPSTRWQWRIDTHYLKLMIFFIDFCKLKCLIGLTYVRGITKFELQKGIMKKPLVA